MLIDGVRELEQAVRAGVRLIEAFYCESLCQSEAAKAVLNTLPAYGAEVFEVDRRVFQKVAFGQRAEGIVVVAHTPHKELSDLKLPDKPLIAVLEGVEKPGNLGAVLRSADAAGVSGVIVADGRTDPYNPSAIRSSLGTVFSLSVVSSSTRETLAWLRQHAMKVYAARVDGSISHTQANYRGPVAIALGGEACGLSAAWSIDDVTAVRIPMLGVADSLNVSVAAAVIFYEALRQRSVRPSERR
jgi:TrmH family RNA methyltransferase